MFRKSRTNRLDRSGHVKGGPLGRSARAGLLAIASLPGIGCAVVNQDQVGVYRTLGRAHPQPLQPGAKLIFPGIHDVVRVPSRTVNREVRLDLPSREGLNVVAEISILYRIRPEMAPRILETAGESYEDDVVLPVFRSAAADITSHFLAKDMHSGERLNIEKKIRERMARLLDSRGFIVENVLLKSISLPPDLARAVEEKLQAEQRAQQMQFVLDRERQEADRKKIEAEGVRNSQNIIAEGLSPMLLSFKSIEAFRDLARSPNAKTIITDGKTPYLIADPLTAGTTAGAVGASSTANAGATANNAESVRLPR